MLMGSMNDLSITQSRMLAFAIMYMFRNINSTMEAPVIHMAIATTVSSSNLATEFVICLITDSDLYLLGLTNAAIIYQWVIVGSSNVLPDFNTFSNSVQTTQLVYICTVPITLNNFNVHHRCLSHLL